MDADETRLLTLGTRILEAAGIEHAKDDARALVALFTRRAAREPLEYILGTCRFRGVELRVDQRVLIPTEERTGTLVVPALDAPRGSRVHEVGTGSGAVALALKAERPDLVVTASDISEEAVDVARDNARRLALDVQFQVADGLPAGDFDLVLANLPYTDDQQATQQLPPEQTEYQPGVALWAGRDSLALIRRLVAGVPEGTAIALEHGPHHTDELHRLLADARTLRDACGDQRVTVGTARPVPAATAAPGGARR